MGRLVGGRVIDIGNDEGVFTTKAQADLVNALFDGVIGMSSGRFAASLEYAGEWYLLAAGVSDVSLQACTVVDAKAPPGTPGIQVMLPVVRVTYDRDEDDDPPPSDPPGTPGTPVARIPDQYAEAA